MARAKEGCRKCMVAFPNEDGKTFGKPEKIEGLGELTYQYTYAEGKAFGDNELKIYKKKPTGATISLTFLDVPTNLVSRILGKKYSKGGTSTNINDKAVPVAILFEETYDDGSYIDTVFYNVKLAKDENTAKTSGESIEFESMKLTGVATPFTNDSVQGDIDFKMDSAESDVDTAKLAKFFDEVQYFTTTPAVESH